MKTVLAALALVALAQSSWATSVQGKCKRTFYNLITENVLNDDIVYS
jgi:hypothetical protein